ncbi:MAG TPA: nitroreductase family protein [Micromonosporaceae bacterium]
MEFQDVVRRRRMVRNYDPDRPVPPDLVDRILGNAIRAPSAGFSQGWGFLVLDRREDVDRFWAAASPEDHVKHRWLDGMTRAPVIVVAHANKTAYLDRYAQPDKGWTDRDEARWPVPYWHIDAGFAALLMLLTVVDSGLAGCFFGIMPERIEPYRREFGVPDEFHPIGAITIGYPADDERSPSLKRGRRSLSEVVHRSAWRRSPS